MTRTELLAALKDSVEALEAQDKDDKVMLEQLCVIDGQWGTWACPGYGGTCSTLFRIKQEQWRPYTPEELLAFVKERKEFYSCTDAKRYMEQVRCDSRGTCIIIDSVHISWSPEGLLGCHWPDGSKMGVKI